MHCARGAVALQSLSLCRRYPVGQRNARPAGYANNRIFILRGHGSGGSVRRGGGSQTARGGGGRRSRGLCKAGGDDAILARGVLIVVLNGVVNSGDPYT
uniref:Uncharacterized protein n=1 Tax=Peronospora matthiolae TaxID=2874970 RepID=A0AAV1VP60_9STRA